MSEWNLASATAYNGKDDQWGDMTARKNPDGKYHAIPNLTIAVDPKVIPYGSWVEVELQDGSIKKFFAHDTGTIIL
jgi:3D (Asp-Asp-Asp) domain-containing protein